MSYHGYIPVVKQFIHQSIPKDVAPTILEIGVDRGVTLFPLVVFLARTRKTFMSVGVDVLVQDQVKIMFQHLDLQQGQDAFCIQGNSLEVMPKLIEQNMKFDVLLLDGDHNYHTVSEEMKHVDKLVKPTGLVICDDYDGRWSERDLFYSEREEYKDVKDTTPRVDTEKHGVKPAIDEWLEVHPEWQKSKPIQGEPIMLMRKAA